MYDTSRPAHDGWRTPEGNPRLLDAQWDDIRRPASVLAHEGGRFVLMGGMPSARKPAGGLLVYDLQTDSGHLLTHEQVIPFHSTYTLIQLPGGLVLGGTCAEEGSDGSARLYRFDVESREVLETWVPVENAYDIRDMVLGEDGLVYGVARIAREDGHPHNGIPFFFVFDSISGEVIYVEDFSNYSTQLIGMNDGGMLVLDGESIYMLFADNIVHIDAQSFEHHALPSPRVTVTNAGVALNGRIYFAAGTRLWSFKALGEGNH